MGSEPITPLTLKDGRRRYRVKTDGVPDASGRRRQVVATFDRLTEARAFLARTRAQMANGSYVPKSEQTLADYVESWLRSRRHAVRPKTIEGYRLGLAPAVRAFGNKRLDLVAKRDVADLVDSMVDAGLAPRTVNLTLGLLRQALNAAVREGILQRNVAQLVDRMPQRHSETDAWTADESRAFLISTREDRLAGAWALTMSGLRRGEVLGLRWEDVVLDGARPGVTVRRSRVSLGRAGGTVSEGEPKSSRSRRRVPLAPYAIDALRHTSEVQDAERAEAGTAYRDSGYLAVNEIGEPIHPDTYSADFQRLAAKAGLRRIRLHDCRHSAISLLLAAGVPVVAVAGVMGHDPVVTQRIYAHMFEDDAVEAMATLDQVLRRS
ncbi:MAG: site-specific integrase [Actinobacteria bacterium]|nr:site-specific integrase [Actinomycetota bacterium]